MSNSLGSENQSPNSPNINDANSTLPDAGNFAGAHLSASEPLKPSGDDTYLPALTGIRFWAIMHIFCFHLWVIFSLEKDAQFQTLLADMGQLPSLAQNFFANGWMSTSFFFVLSGFILAYLYWRPDGQLSLPKAVFWRLRLARIYPIHLIVLAITIPLFAQFVVAQGDSLALLISSALATATLTQAWYPAWVPVWSWPTWTLSALIFLYLVMPFIMPKLARLTRRQQWTLLCALPFISLLPTGIYSVYFPTGSKPVQFWQIFIGSTPLFWLAHFVAGMLLARLCALSKFNPREKPKGVIVAWGDLALIAVFALACIPNIQEPLKYFLRHGLMMPLFLLIILDLARGRGLAARVFSLRLMTFLGQIGLSIFIWQNLVMAICWGTAGANPALGAHQFKWAIFGIILLGVFSTFVIEKPIARWLRHKR